MEGQIDKIIEVKNLKELQDKINPSDSFQIDHQIKKNQTPDKRGEHHANDLAGQVNTPNQSSNSLLDKISGRRNSGGASSLLGFG